MSGREEVAGGIGKGDGDGNDVGYFKQVLELLIVLCNVLRTSNGKDEGESAP